jgi:hypothetical protein
MLHCMQQLIRARHHVPSDMLPPCVQPLIRSEASRVTQSCRHVRSY